MWSKAYWLATLERMLRGGAAASLSTWVVGDNVMNAFDVNLQQAGGIFVGGAVVSLLLSLAVNGATGNGPAVTNHETVV